MSLPEIYETHATTVRALTKPSGQIFEQLDDGKLDAAHMAMGLCVEVGDLFDATSKGLPDILGRLGNVEFYWQGFMFSTDMGVPFGHKEEGYDGWPLKDLMGDLTVCSAGILGLVKEDFVHDQGYNVMELCAKLFAFRGILNEIYNVLGLNIEEAKSNNVDKLAEIDKG